jgi:hypothetical protein
VSTTNPAAGRGVSLGLLQAQALHGMLAHDRHGAAGELGQWCEQNIRPWYDDHVYWDATLLRRWRGEDLDLDAPIPSDVICAAGEVDPSLASMIMPYLAMIATPAVLQPAQERVREILRTGWRPRLADGPSRDDLAAVLSGGRAVSAMR